MPRESIDVIRTKPDKGLFFSNIWKRKPKVANTSLGSLLLPVKQPKKEFEVMISLLTDAEKYDSEGELDVRDVCLTGLIEYIERFKSRNNRPSSNKPSSI